MNLNGHCWLSLKPFWRDHPGQEIFEMTKDQEESFALNEDVFNIWF
jgi:hypothetical protein